MAGDQAPGQVVQRRGQHIGSAAALDHFAVMHHQHLIADVFHHSVLSDIDIGDALFLLQLQHQVDKLGAHRHIQRGQRLIADDNLRAQDQRLARPRRCF